MWILWTVYLIFLVFSLSEEIPNAKLAIDPMISPATVVTPQAIIHEPPVTQTPATPHPQMEVNMIPSPNSSIETTSPNPSLQLSPPLVATASPLPPSQLIQPEPAPPPNSSPVVSEEVVPGQSLQPAESPPAMMISDPTPDTKIELSNSSSKASEQIGTEPTETKNITQNKNDTKRLHSISILAIVISTASIFGIFIIMIFVGMNKQKQKKKDKNKKITTIKENNINFQNPVSSFPVVRKSTLQSRNLNNSDESDSPPPIMGDVLKNNSYYLSKTPGNIVNYKTNRLISVGEVDIDSNSFLMDASSSSVYIAGNSNSNSEITTTTKGASAWFHAAGEKNSNDSETNRFSRYKQSEENLKIKDTSDMNIYSNNNKTSNSYVSESDSYCTMDPRNSYIITKSRDSSMDRFTSFCSSIESDKEKSYEL